MSVSTVQRINQNYLFTDPLNKSQPLWQRIANAVFHILTLAIPLIIYKLYAYCSSALQARQDKNVYAAAVELQKKAIADVKKSGQTAPHSSLGLQALEFSRAELARHPEIEPFVFRAGYARNTHQPVNPEIARLTKLFWNELFNNFKQTLKNGGADPWSRPEVLTAADACMKVAYAISTLTLEDLKPFTDRLRTQGIERDNAQALTEQDSYQYRTFYFCTNAYHWLRGEILAEERNGKVELDPDYMHEMRHSPDFYTAGTLKNSWNILYNEYCSRIRMYVDEAALYRKDNRHVNWTKLDTSETLFSRVPDTQPT